MAGVHKHATAKRDLIEHFVYLAEEAGIETAERFLQNAESTFCDLSMHREIGVGLSLLEPKLTGLRRWHIKGFESFLVFYLSRTDGVTVVRVLHASRDWWGMFGISS
jgi:toxin ParE1/3/4